MLRRKRTPTTKYKPKFMQQQQKLKSIQNNPCLIHGIAHPYGPNKLQRAESEHFRSYFYCLEQKGLPLLDDPRRKLNYLRNRLKFDFGPTEQEFQIAEKFARKSSALILEDNLPSRRRESLLQKQNNLLCEQEKQAMEQPKIFTISRRKIRHVLTNEAIKLSFKAHQPPKSRLA